MIVLPPGPVFTLSGWGDTRDMTDWCSGLWADRSVTRIPYPASLSRDSIPTGVRMLSATFLATGPCIVVGHSEGAQVISRWIELNPNAAVDVTFVLLGNPLRRPGGRMLRESDGTAAVPTLDCRWKVIDVARRKDPWACKDCCGRTWWWYSITVHSNYRNVNVNDPANTVTRRGNTILIDTD